LILNKNWADKGGFGGWRILCPRVPICFPEVRKRSWSLEGLSSWMWMILEGEFIVDSITNPLNYHDDSHASFWDHDECRWPRWPEGIVDKPTI